MNTIALAMATSAWLADVAFERSVSIRNAFAIRETADGAGPSAALGLGLACTGMLAAAGVGAGIAALLAGEAWRPAGLASGYAAALCALGIWLRARRLTNRVAPISLLAITACTLLLAAAAHGLRGSAALVAVGLGFGLLLATLQALRTQAATGIPPWRSALIVTAAALVLDGLLRPWSGP